MISMLKNFDFDFIKTDYAFCNPDYEIKEGEKSIVDELLEGCTTALESSDPTQGVQTCRTILNKLLYFFLVDICGEQLSKPKTKTQMPMLSECIEHKMLKICLETVAEEEKSMSLAVLRFLRDLENTSSHHFVMSDNSCITDMDYYLYVLSSTKITIYTISKLIMKIESDESFLPKLKAENLWDSILRLSPKENGGKYTDTIKVPLKVIAKEDPESGNVKLALDLDIPDDIHNRVR